MKIGLLAYSSNTGLGYQTRDFYKNIKCAKVLIADLSDLNKMDIDHSWVKGDFRISKGIPSNDLCEWLVDDMDIVFVCETPLNYHLFTHARSKGVKTVQQLNYEFLEHLTNPKLPAADLFAMPSYWGFGQVEDLGLAKTVYLPVPVETKRLDQKIIKEANTFTHIAGRPAANDRNGTILFIKAAAHLGKRYQYKIYIQKPKDEKTKFDYDVIKNQIDKVKGFCDIELVEDTKNSEDMYKDNAVMVLPRRYGGLCLPLWEALGSGQPVIMPRTSPNETNLYPHWLCSGKFSGYFKTRVHINLFESDILDLSKKMVDAISNIERNSKAALDLGNLMSWKRQKDRYMKVLKELL